MCFSSIARAIVTEKKIPHHGLSLIEMSHHIKSAEAFRVLKTLHEQKIDVVQSSKQQNKDRLFLVQNYSNLTEKLKAC